MRRQLAQAGTIAAINGRSAPRRWLSAAQDCALVVISTIFLYFHGRHVLEDGSLTSAFFAIEQALLVAIFLGRTRSTFTSTRPIDWISAALGGWLALGLQPQNQPLGFWTMLGTGIQVFGLTLVVLSLLTMKGSFGVVAANRGLKTSGPYRIVRHPIYLGHTATQLGFLASNFYVPNAVLLLVVWYFQFLRIRAEERVLMEGGDYLAYRTRVPYRLIPGLY